MAKPEKIGAKANLRNSRQILDIQGCETPILKGNRSRCALCALFALKTPFLQPLSDPRIFFGGLCSLRDLRDCSLRDLRDCSRNIIQSRARPYRALFYIIQSRSGLVIFDFTFLLLTSQHLRAVRLALIDVAHTQSYKQLLVCC